MGRETETVVRPAPPRARDPLLKRPLDAIAAAVGLAALSPLLALTAALVRVSSPGPALFRQVRVGRHGRDFVLYKFRTMTVRTASESGSFEPGDRSRVTRVGGWLRATKLDELPQLWNVLRGDMSLVGPRPEIRKWVQTYPERWAEVLSVTPGITDPAAIEYRHEERLLAAAPDPEALYRDQILPHKLHLYADYVRTRTFFGDLKILLGTVAAVVGRHGSPLDPDRWRPR